MKSIVLHFGMPKTGSSSIQESLYRSPDLPIHYLQVNRANSGLIVAAAFSPNPMQFHAFRFGNTRKDVVKRLGKKFRKGLTKQLTHSDKTMFVLSAEYMYNADAETLYSLKQFLLQHVDKVRAMGYIRPPKSFIESAFQQTLKVGPLRPIERHFRTPEYQNNLSKIIDIFGEENVQLRLFDPKTFPDNCVVKDFCHQIGVKELDGLKVINTNESLCRDAVAFLYTYKKLGPSSEVGPTRVVAETALVDKLAELKGEKFKLSKRFIRKSLVSLRQDIPWVETQMGVKFPDESATKLPSEINSEKDFFHYDETSILWLASLSGADHSLDLASVTPEMIAEWMHKLFEKFSANVDLSKSNKNAPYRYLDQVAKRLPAETKITTQQISDIQTALYGQIADYFNKANNGDTLRLPNLGTLIAVDKKNKKGDTVRHIRLRQQDSDPTL